MSFLVAIEAGNILKVFVVGLHFRLVIVIGLSSFPIIVIVVILLVPRSIRVVVLPRLVVIRFSKVILILIEV